MADDYGELVELGFEGVDKFATKFHDPCHDYVSKKRPHWHNRKGKKGKEEKRHDSPQRARSEPPEDEDAGPDRGLDGAYDDDRDRHPPPQSRGHDRGFDDDRDRDHHSYDRPPPPPQDRGFDGGFDGAYDDWERDHHSHDRLPLPPPPPFPPHLNNRRPPRGDRDDMYVSERRRERDSWGDGEMSIRDDRTVVGGRDRSRDRSFNDSGTVVVRGGDTVGYAGPIVPRAPLPPVPYAPRSYIPPYGERLVYETSRPLPPRRRSSSYSSPRRYEPRDISPHRRHRSKSPNHHRVVATLVGALAGGVVGNSASNKSHGWATVGGAIVGGIAGREIEKRYDRHEDKKFEEQERRERRRREREQWA